MRECPEAPSEYIIYRGDLLALARSDETSCTCCSYHLKDLDVGAIVDCLPADSLEHLILTIETSIKGLALVLSQRCVPDLRRLDRLTHLEIDTWLFLRVPVSTTYSNATKTTYRLKSLVDYCPPSIIFVRLHTNGCDSAEDIGSLLGNLGARRSEVQSLRIIQILEADLIHRPIYLGFKSRLRSIGIDICLERDNEHGQRILMRLNRQDESKGIDPAYFGSEVVKEPSRH